MRCPKCGGLTKGPYGSAMGPICGAVVKAIPPLKILPHTLCDGNEGSLSEIQLFVVRPTVGHIFYRAVTYINSTRYSISGDTLTEAIHGLEIAIEGGGR